MNKRDLRQQILDKRAALSPTERQKAQQAILFHAHQSGLCTRYKSVAGYFPMRGEVDVRPIMALMATQGAEVALPCIEQNDRMVFRYWRPDDPLEAGKHAIPCPAHGEEMIPEMVLLPLVACDERGIRLGMGGGYYDRMLAQPAYKDCYRLGIGFAFQLLPRLPNEAHDVRVHAFLSEQGLLEFK